MSKNELFTQQVYRECYNNDKILYFNTMKACGFPMILNITDTLFSHQPSCVAGRTADKIQWVQDGSGDSRYQFYTNFACYGPIREGCKNIAWLLESQAILPETYKYFDTVSHKFDVILTHSSEILAKYPDKAKLLIPAGSYIGTEHGGGEEKIYDKTRFCSIVSSSKNMCPLHAFRYNLANQLKASGKVDVFGTVLGENEWSPIIGSLADYKYSIVIENYIDDSFFTEKLINVLLTGSVPIYYGARKIDDYFNSDGIIKFSTYEELTHILSQLQSIRGDYSSRLSAIRDNFDRAKNYVSPETQIYDNLSKWLGE